MHMENIKFYAVTFLLIVGAGFLGYGAISSLRDPVYYVNNQTALTTVGELKQGSSPETPAADVASETPATNAEPVTAPVATTTPVAPVAETKPETTTTTGSKNADLIARLQKISGTLKKGTSGDSVKAVQEALNIVAKAGLPTNGSFGAQTEAAVKKFQTSAKLPSTGQVASKTIAALVAKLK